LKSAYKLQGLSLQLPRRIRVRSPVIYPFQCRHSCWRRPCHLVAPVAL